MLFSIEKIIQTEKEDIDVSKEMHVLLCLASWVVRWHLGAAAWRDTAAVRRRYMPPHCRLVCRETKPPLNVITRQLIFNS